jgi:16S rRNA (adenine1518-N6/adenine1519-N6)-dimethyltransferase
MSRISEITRALRDRGLSLNKKLGQHLLIDPNVRGKLVHAADLTKGDIAIEIGAGTGLITEDIADVAGHTVAIEIDRGFAGYLAERFHDDGRVTVIHEDVLKCDLGKLYHDVTSNSGLSSVVFIGNLPFNINSQIVMKLAESTIPMRQCIFILQREVAERYSAAPGTESYGSISLSLQYNFRLETMFSIAGEFYYPSPEVETMAVRMIPHDEPPVHLVDRTLFFRIIRAGFMQRRKMLKNSLRKIPEFRGLEDKIDHAFAAADIPLEIRPEKLSLAQFASLANSLASSS